MEYWSDGGIKNGVLEYWNNRENGMDQYPSTPLLQYFVVGVIGREEE